MVLKNETILTGASNTCPECGIHLTLKVLRSAAGYYIGTICNCGPYSRESGYYKDYQSAQEALDSE